MTQPVIWFAQSAYDINSNPGYVPMTHEVADTAAGLEARLSLKDRLNRGELVPAEELPSDYGLAKRRRPGSLTMPIFYNSFTVIRRDVAEVMQRFDLGATVLRPIVIHLDGGGTNEDYLILACANVRPTIDDARSEPIRLGDVKRLSLMTEGKPVHPGVVALPSALEGPDLWTDPEVISTLFLSDPLARALIGTGFDKGGRRGMNLKQVRVGEGAAGAPGATRDGGAD